MTTAFQNTSKGEGAGVKSSALVAVSEAKERLIADLRKVRPFPDGTLIRWKMLGSNQVTYTFAAMFVAGSWYSTAQGNNPMVNPKMSHQTFLNLIASNPLGIFDLEIASDFEKIDL
ncbi:hypothetical protein G7068_16010 [Leucobacter viscericola]|uniref:Uncharacterized protein n=1 Tax=Leucobacter viscericola TaxID=2714935 RepID=A0A6G7XJK5_9MICO|nr:hypothetical protein [Leucobacter viscericola]QIK64551.1 hypothetical protein G7068_16010 [Leucobacter viscericola]